jgi:tripartite-type tricarboxylate transporter receptor subunit TctC
MDTLRRRLVAASLASALAPLPRFASAQEVYPSKPVRLILGFSAGGISDVLGRSLAVRISPSLGQQMVVENKPGAGSTLAADFVARSAPDGYTIWLQDMTAHAINATMYTKLPYDSLKDFAPITLVAYTPLMLVVHPDHPAKTVQELVAYLKANRNKASYGSAGSGTANQIAAEILKRSADVPDIVHIPYKGSSPSALAVLGKEVDFAFLSMPPAVSNVQSGRMRGLAVTSLQRVPAVPNIPTMAESGFPGFDLVVYSGILAPAGTPQPIINRLNAEFVKATQSEEVRAAYAKIGAEAITTTPEEMRVIMEKDIARLAPIVKASGATAN